MSDQFHQIAESIIIDTLYRVARRLAHKYRFGYHSDEDIVQEAVVIGLQGLKHYDGRSPLENFLYVHMKNRLFNYRRDNYERLYRNKETRMWESRHNDKRKKNIMSPISIDSVRDDGDSNMRVFDDADEKLDNKDVFMYIDTHLSVAMRRDYIKLRYGYKLPKHRIDALTEEIKRIVGEYNGAT